MALLDFLLGTVGYSLIRFSTKKQACGDSFRRQVSLAEAFATRHNITLDTSLHEADIRKLGMSGLSGEHVVKGPLRKFFAGIKNGTVKPGSVLLVSEWNRLTRQVSSDALKLVIHLMELGIGILDLQDESYYTLDRYNADVGLQLGLQLKISMAHQYSANLRHNLNAKWEGRRLAMQAGKSKPTNASSDWLSVREDGEWNAVERDGELWAVIENPDIERAIQRVKADRFLRLGKHAIATRLNDANQPGGKVPAFRGKIGWHPSAVEKLVKSEALRGVHRPCKFVESEVEQEIEGRKVKVKVKRLEPTGEVYENHYPRVMSDADWYRMQWPEQRMPRGKRTGGVLNNLFAELFRCSCGAGLVRENKGKHKGGAFLICSKARRGLCADRTRHHLDTLEAEVFKVLTLFDTSRFIEKANPQADKIAALEAEIATKNATIEEQAAGFGSNVPPAFFRRMQKMQAEVDDATARLAEARRNAKIAEASAVGDAHAEFVALVAGMGEMEGEDLYQLRLRLAGELRRLMVVGVAEGDELVVQLCGQVDQLQVELVLRDARFVELRLVIPANELWAEHEHGDCFVWSRDQIFNDPEFDPIGEFEAFITGTSAAA